MEGIGGGEVEIESVVERVGGGGIKEVVFGVSRRMEGDRRKFYI